MTLSTDLLNRDLAALIDLWAREKHAHWNCVGPAFIGVHKLFDDLAENAEGYADSLAERIRYLDEEAYGTVRAAATSYLSPYLLGIAKTEAHLAAIERSLESAADTIKSRIPSFLTARDQATADVLIEITRGLEHDCYLVKSHLKA